MLDNDTRQQLEARILESIAETEQRIIDLEKITAPVAPDKSLGRITRLDMMSDKAINDDALDQARETLHRLELSLTKVHEPAFGLCIACGEFIPIERIMLLPQSTRCVDCAK